MAPPLPCRYTPKMLYRHYFQGIRHPLGTVTLQEGKTGEGVRASVARPFQRRSILAEGRREGPRCRSVLMLGLLARGPLAPLSQHFQ
jgi:hypothetical protein